MSREASLEIPNFLWKHHGVGELLQFRRMPEDPGEPTGPCPRCGKPVDKAAIRCRRCGASTLPSSREERGLPWWIWLGILLSIAVLVGFLVGGRG